MGGSWKVPRLVENEQKIIPIPFQITRAPGLTLTLWNRLSKQTSRKISHEHCHVQVALVPKPTERNVLRQRSRDFVQKLS